MCDRVDHGYYDDKDDDEDERREERNLLTIVQSKRTSKPSLLLPLYYFYISDLVTLFITCILMVDFYVTYFMWYIVIKISFIKYREFIRNNQYPYLSNTIRESNLLGKYNRDIGNTVGCKTYKNICQVYVM